MGIPGSAPNVTQEDVRGVFAQLERPTAPTTAGEVAEKLDCTDQIARDRLDALADRGELHTKRIGDATRVWWRPEFEQSDEAEFAAFVSAVKDYAIFMLDPDGTVVSWNEGAKRIKGYRKDEIVGEHFSTFYTDDDADEGVPERNLEAAMTDGRVEDEGWRVRDDGTRFWANVTITAIRDDSGTLRGFTKVTRDMTERRQYEQRLRYERDLTEQILETVPVSICVVTGDGDIVRANRRLVDWLDIDRSDLEDRGVESWELYDAEGDPIPTDERPSAQVFATGEPVSEYQCQVELSDTDRRWLSITAAPLEYSEHDGDRVVVSIDDITDQKEREQKLHRQYEQTEQLLQTAPVAIAVQNTDRETVMANERAQEVFDLSEREFTDNPIDSGEWKVYDADGEPLDPAETPSGRVLETGEPVIDEELTFESPTGERMQLRINAAPLFDADGAIDRIVTAGKDITELKERERQLEQRKAELETELSEILGRISDAFYALDEEWQFTHLNDQAAAVIEHPPDELLGQEIWEVVPETSAELYREQFQTAMETQEPVNFEVYEDDVDTWLEFSVYPSESGISVYFRDISERKEYQRKLEESNERLEQFAYAASHDLQEPLRMVTSYLQLLERRYADDLDGDAREFIGFAVDGAERMREMIDGLLEYSRVETRGDPFEPVDVDDVLANVLENLQVQISESHAEITADSLPTVSGDESQLQQLFQNLLSNAIEYSGDEPPRVHLSADRRGREWVISVRDEGIGIDPDEQDRIFEVFQRLHSHEEHSGTGIGLALCRRIVERHGGRIWVDSEPGEGTTFSITLPAA
ncbi:PAS domain-containing sensor histidine kinase [Natrinema salifodinae]|uniref:histidine kinase n=1 Tax=Natrinema salifodinae TaxID=1202768 RepID=A0A1I0QW36_9EURY|nr:PAS domain S-box protein [Natrinema salifodinae]SEW31687.1 PAS domain S-box-containing protein [Natrinema salifodinae]